MTDTSRTRVIKNYRRRLIERGLTRIEVGLAEGEAEAAAAGVAIGQPFTLGHAEKGGIVAAFRRSPLVGADLDLTRSQDSGREIDL